jgi:hypothetical protein
MWRGVVSSGVAGVSFASALFGLVLGVPAAHAWLAQEGWIKPDLDRIARPVDEIMDAWFDRNFERYRAQWSPRAVQDIGNGRRSLGEILASRRGMFATLHSVSLNDYQRCVAEWGDGEVQLFVRYDMTLNRMTANGLVADRDREVETYTVEFSPRRREYLITRNETSPWPADEPPCELRSRGAENSAWSRWLLG